MNGSEKLTPKVENTNPADSPKDVGEKVAAVINDEAAKKEPRFPKDPNQYDEDYFKQNPSARFRLNPDDFPFLSMQAVTVGITERGEKKETLPLDYTASTYIRATADLVAILAGETSEYSHLDVAPPPTDLAIYLDKSARPVGWFVNVFWDAFANKEKPPKSAHMALDRGRWLRAFGVNADADGRLIDTGELATPDMIKEEDKQVSLSLKASVRALFIPGGVETDDPETIMNTPTGLDGKNISIIDEVSRSGSSLELAKILVSQAIPEAASVNGYTFWKPGLVAVGNTGNHEIDSVPFWYDKHTRRGRGIDDPDPEHWALEYDAHPGPITRARRIGAALLGVPYDLSTDAGDASRELMREIKTLRKEWDANHVMMFPGVEYDVDKWEERLAEQGIVNSYADRGDAFPSNDQRSIVKALKNRQPVPPHFLA